MEVSERDWRSLCAKRKEWADQYMAGVHAWSHVLGYYKYFRVTPERKRYCILCVCRIGSRPCDIYWLSLFVHTLLCLILFITIGCRSVQKPFAWRQGRVNQSPGVNVWNYCVSSFQSNRLVLSEIWRIFLKFGLICLTKYLTKAKTLENVIATRLFNCPDLWTT